MRRATTARKRRRRRLGLLALALLVAACRKGPAPSAPPHADIPDPDLSDAEATVVEKTRDARAAVEREPDSARLWGRYAVILDAHGFAPEAIAAYRVTARLDPGSARWPYLLATVLIASDPAGALEPLERAIELDPRSPARRNAAGDALAQLGRDEEARARYEEALAIDPAWRPSLLGLAELALRRGDLDAAQHLLTHAEEIERHDREVHAKLARLYRRRGDTARAERESLFVQAYPDLAPVNDPDRAIVDLAAVSAKAHTTRGLALVAIGRYLEAERAFRRALESRPDNVRNHVNLAGTLTRQGRRDEALAELAQTLSMDKDDPDVHNSFAAVLLDEGRLDEAHAHAEEALRLDGRSDAAHLNMGLIRERQGRLDEAEAAYREALALNPVNVPAHRALAALLEARGARLEALSHWLDAVDFGREDPNAAVRFAMGASQLGRFGDALAVLERARRQAPNDVFVLSTLVTILATCPEAEHRDGPRAVELAGRLVGLTGSGHVVSLNLLAAAQAEAGDYEGAVRTCEDALARAAGQPEMVRTIESRIRLYRAGRAYHQGGRD